MTKGPITAEATLEHYGERLEGERSRISEQFDELAEQSQHLTKVGEVLELFAEDPTSDLGVSSRWPLISHLLLRKAYADLRYSSGIGESELKVVGETLPDLLGSPVDEVSGSGEIDTDRRAVPGTCPDLEFHFTAAVDQALGREVHPFNKNQDIWIYHDDEGIPLVLRESREPNSGILLEACELSGVKVPAGTAVGVGSNMTIRGNDGGIHTLPDRTRLITHIAPRELHLTPRRITPWVHDNPLDRAIFAIDIGLAKEPHITNPNRINTVTRHSLEDFRLAAANVMALCGSGTPAPADPN